MYVASCFLRNICRSSISYSHWTLCHWVYWQIDSYLYWYI